MSVFRPDLFKDKVALITGGGTGIGHGIALDLARHGADTVICSRSLEHLEPAAERLREEGGGRSLPVACDVRDNEAVEAVVARTIEELGRLDIVVNSAAGNFLCPAATLSPNGFKTVLEIDTQGTWQVSRAAYHAWLQQHGGQILNISATLQYLGTPMQVHAAAAKAAIDAMTRTLAVEWGGQGIRVNAIAPGPIDDTPGMAKLAVGEWRDRTRKLIPTGRLGTIEDISQLALFILSPAGSNLNGEIVVSDGGHWLSGPFAQLMSG